MTNAEYEEFELAYSTEKGKESELSDHHEQTSKLGDSYIDAEELEKARKAAEEAGHCQTSCPTRAEPSDETEHGAEAARKTSRNILET